MTIALLDLSILIKVMARTWLEIWKPKSTQHLIIISRLKVQLDSRKMISLMIIKWWWWMLPILWIIWGMIMTREALLLMITSNLWVRLELIQMRANKKRRILWFSLEEHKKTRKRKGKQTLKGIFKKWIATESFLKKVAVLDIEWVLMDTNKYIIKTSKLIKPIAINQMLIVFMSRILIILHL